MRRLISAALVSFVLLAPASRAADVPPVRVLVAYGGHGFHTNQYFRMWGELPGVTYATCELPRQADLLKPGLETQYDAMVFYDMSDGFTDVQKKNFVDLLNRGIGIVATHHTLGAHNNWPEYWNIIGGHYLHKPETLGGKAYGRSSYADDQTMQVKIADSMHPVTAGLADFTIHDEAYRDFYVAPDAHVLMTVDHPKCDRDVAWTKTYGRSRVCYFMFGHDEKAWDSPVYRKLLANALQWVAKGARAADPAPARP